MKKLFFLTFLLLIVLFQFCDKIDNPYPAKKNGGIDTTIKRKILLEDYTGHTCPNCPAAAVVAKQLKDDYGDRLIVMGVHVGFFAEPCPPHPLPQGAPAGSYANDFRTTEGESYNTTFGNDGEGLPNGMVNRKEFGGTKVLDKTAWNSAIAAIINTPADVNIKITNTYDTITRNLNCSVQSTFVNGLSGNYKLVVLITQDSIIDWQLDGSNNVQNYVHRHVLRGAINSVWGDVLVNGNVVAGATSTKSYPYTINAGWDVAQCEVVAFIYNESTNEILQAAEEKVIQ